MIDDAADQWLLAHGYKAKRDAPDMGHLWEAPNELVWPYAGTDSVVGAILDDLLDASIDAANLRTVDDNERIPMAVDYAVHDREGLRVNPMKLEQFSRDLAVARDLINARLTHLVGHELNINSPKQIQKYLYEQPYPIIAYTDMGQPSTREEYLLELARMIDDPVIHLILRGRGYAKLDGTYVTGKEGRPG